VKHTLPKLFWLVYAKDDDITVFLQPGDSLAFARLKAAIAGMEGDYREGHMLDDKFAKKVPKKMIGRALSRNEATALLKKMG
jgi:hypothetical protein